jgi:hypothetical protein
MEERKNKFISSDAGLTFSIRISIKDAVLHKRFGISEDWL